MFGIANPTDYTTTTSGNKVAIAQFSTGTKDDKLKAFLNYQGGSTGDKNGFNQFDLVLNAAISSKFALNYDGTVASVKTNGTTNSWTSNALYFNYDPSSKFGLTLREEYFDDKNSVSTAGIASSVLATTLSANIKLDHLTIVPEIRIDNGNNAIFYKSNGTTTQTTSGFILAAIYKF